MGDGAKVLRLQESAKPERNLIPVACASQNRFAAAAVHALKLSLITPAGR